MLQKSQPPEILFIERCVQLLTPGVGRFALVIPNGILNNPALGYVRTWLMQNTQVLAIVDMARELFQPKNDTQTSMVLARRLSNAEYDYTIRDLTGVDLRPTREFPVDPANQEGFDNSGESLTLSPALLKKYLQAARGIADHLVLNSTGIAFASHPMLVETDRDKYSILRIVDFYHRAYKQDGTLVAECKRQGFMLKRPAETVAV